MCKAALPPALVSCRRSFVLFSDAAGPGDSVTPQTQLTRREARALESAPEPQFAYTPGPVIQPPNRRDSRPIGKNGKRLTDRQIAKQLKATARKGRPTNRRPSNDRSAPKPRIGQRFMSVGAMLFAGALLVGMSVPANAFITQTASDPGAGQLKSALPAQSLDVADDAAALSASRDTFSVNLSPTGPPTTSALALTVTNCVAAFAVP
jgi:hypothetical protein